MFTLPALDSIDTAAIILPIFFYFFPSFFLFRVKATKGERSERREISLADREFNISSSKFLIANLPSSRECPNIMPLENTSSRVCYDKYSISKR